MREVEPASIQRLVGQTPVLSILGPTASGKTEVALFLAEKLKGEIISVDSMQVYRGLNLGTAKPSKEERERVAHHLVDVLELTQSFDAAQFVRLASRALDEIRGRGRLPILCGGTGLYFKALFEGLGDAPAADPALRAELEATPLADLLRELAERDRTAFDRIDRQNPRRVIRALEVVRLSGKAGSPQRSPWSQTSPLVAHTPAVFGLNRSTEDLRRRIDVRVDRMFQAGLVSETEQLIQRGLAQNSTALQALGYRQVVEHLEGLRSLPETIALVKIRTRQFAKRQMTWFRRQLPVRWIEVTPDHSADLIANAVARQFTSARTS